MPDFTVIRVGTDTSNRPIYMTRFAWDVWQAVLRDPDVAPFAHLIVIVQGAFMSRVPGGGADTSAGYHDLGGCWDIRTWNLTVFQLNALIKTLRRYAIAAWRRDLSAAHGGMDSHCHVTAGWDHPLSGGAATSWAGYLHNENGLASHGVDYEWRPVPLVTYPPASLLKEDYMATADAEKRLSDIQTQLQHVVDLQEASASADERRWAAERERDRAERKRQSERYSKFVAKVGSLVDIAKDGQVAVEEIQRILSEEPDVTGADNPAPQEV